MFLPVLGAFVVHAPVLRWRLLPGLLRPLDGGWTFRGRRVFGDNKTWRGALAMFTGVLLATLALWACTDYASRLPAPLRTVGPLEFGARLGLGLVLGELPNSFLKRQLDIAPGKQRRSPGGALLSVFDQGDFVLGVWLMLAPVWCMTIAEVGTAFVGVVVVHLLVNVIGFAIGARRNLL